VNKGGTIAATFVYDGDGRRVKSEAYTNGALTKTILFIGAHYEVTKPAKVSRVYLAHATGT
jgi:hypothetical protein